MRQRRSAEQIIGKLREAEVAQGKRMPKEERFWQLGFGAAIKYEGQKEYGAIDRGTPCLNGGLEKGLPSSESTANSVSGHFNKAWPKTLESNLKPVRCEITGNRIAMLMSIALLLIVLGIKLFHR